MNDAEIVSLEANRVVVRARPSESVYLVLSETNYPGWRVEVDGVERPIYSAYSLFRAVHLEPGPHEVVFTFMPASYAIAWKASLLCVCIAGGLTLLGVARGLRAMTPNPASS